MRCPYCVEGGKKSRVYPGMSTTTCMASYSYYDEDGNYHHDDPNVRSTGYTCSNGHKWVRSTQRGETETRALHKTANG